MRTWTAELMLGASALALAGCSSGDGGGGDGMDPPPAPNWSDPEVAVIERLDFDEMIDGIRLDDGRGVLSIDDRLSEASQDYASLMVSTGEFGNNVGGTTATESAAAAGYDASFMAENIAQGPTTSDAVLDLWMDGGSSRANILNTNAEDFGIGRVDDTWVLMLGREQ